MEQHRGFTIVMTDDGLFEKAYPIENASIGFEVEYEPMIKKQWLALVKEKLFTMRIGALACVFLIALFSLFMLANNNSTYAYVDIDINPSIELEINEDLEVSGILPLNEDATLLLEKLGNVKGKDIEVVVDRIITLSEKTGLVNADKNVLIGVHYVEEDTSNSVLDVIDHHFTEKASEWEVITLEIPEEVRETAEENNISMNKVLANTVKEQSIENIDSIVTEEDTKVLQSFFNYNPKTKTETTTKESKQDTNVNPDDGKSDEVTTNPSGQSLHPSELKGKNGEINSSKQEEKLQKKDIHHQKKSEKTKHNKHDQHPKHKDKKKEKDRHQNGQDNWNQEKQRNQSNENKYKSNDHKGKSNDNKPNHGQQKRHDRGHKENGNYED